VGVRRGLPVGRKRPPWPPGWPGGSGGGGGDGGPGGALTAGVPSRPYVEPTLTAPRRTHEETTRDVPAAISRDGGRAWRVRRRVAFCRVRGGGAGYEGDAPARR